jgi:hypothetical protein
MFGSLLGRNVHILPLFSGLHSALLLQESNFHFHLFHVMTLNLTFMCHILYGVYLGKTFAVNSVIPKKVM